MPSPVSTAGRDFYLAYLNSPAWRATRNRALYLARWRCEKCGAKRALQVHHRSYERLGGEWDVDLEVLCEGCHREVTLAAGEQGPLGVYFKLGRQVIADHGFAAFADLSAEVKALCARQHVDVDPRRIEKVLTILTRERPQPQVVIRRDRIVLTAKHIMPETPAVGTLIRLVRERLIKPWPGSVRTPAAQERIVREQAREYHRAIYLAERIRRPLAERLEEIWR